MCASLCLESSLSVLTGHPDPVQASVHACKAAAMSVTKTQSIDFRKARHEAQKQLLPVPDVDELEPAEKEKQTTHKMPKLRCMGSSWC